MIIIVINQLRQINFNQVSELFCPVLEFIDVREIRICTVPKRMPVSTYPST